MSFKDDEDQLIGDDEFVTDDEYDFDVPDMDPSYHHDEWNEDSWVEQTYEELMEYAALKKEEEEAIDGDMPGSYSHEEIERIEGSINKLVSSLNEEKERIALEYKTASKYAAKNPGKALRLVNGLERDIENLMMRLTNETDPIAAVSDDEQIDLLFTELMKVKQLKESILSKKGRKQLVSLRPAASKKKTKKSSKKSKTKSKKSAKKKKD